MNLIKNRRVLVIDDNRAIHDDIRRILRPDADEPRSLKLGRALLDMAPAFEPREEADKFEIDSCYQGKDGLEKVRQANAENRPYAIALVDIRMPPGWDGVETLNQIWKEDSEIQAVICTAYSDYSWEEIASQFGSTDRLLILKKPFDKIELLQMASASIAKWNLSRQAHEALNVLQETRDRLFTTLQSIGDGVVATDSGGRIVEINPVAERLTGCKRDDALGRNTEDVLKFVDCHSHQLITDPIKQVLNKGQIVELPDNTQLLRSDGREIPIADCSAPIKSNGMATGAVMVFRDITEHRKAQQEIKRLYREAIEANRLKDEFLANVSHELRTPLTSVMGWISLLRRHALSHEQTQRAIEVIERNTKSQSRLIEDLLDVSRIISGKMKLDITEVDLSKLVHSVADQLMPGAVAKSLSIEVFVHDAIPPVSADLVRMHQIVSNLISNSIKFTPPGGHVEVHLQRSDDSIQIVVKDTGKGISPEFLPHVFDRFRQEDCSTSRSHSGLGLGLAIVSELVEMHGGTIEASSEGVGLGATFTVKLPIPAPDIVKTPQA